VTSAGGPASGESLVEFVAVMRRLRAECPWKAAQTHDSLARYLLEETHETLEAIDAGEASDDWGHLREELGDLLLQVYFHAAIAEERGEWTIDDVAADIVAKLRRRNPHVFGEATGEATGVTLTPEQVNAEWERRKAQEKSQRTAVTDGLPPGLPALLYADKVLDRLARTGRHAPRSPARPVPLTSDELGAELLALVAGARAAGLDPEQALRHAVRREVEAAGTTEP
jgi:XTP/dITP diphosphohydrolase